MNEHFPDFSETELVKRFTLEEIRISRDGEYGICIGDRKDLDCALQPDADLAILLSPEVKFYDSQEQFMMWVL